MDYYNDIERQPTSMPGATDAAGPNGSATSAGGRAPPPIPPRPGGSGNAASSSSCRARGAEWDSNATPPSSTRASHYGRVGGGVYTEKTTLLSSDEEVQWSDLQENKKKHLINCHGNLIL